MKLLSITYTIAESRTDVLKATFHTMGDWADGDMIFELKKDGQVLQKSFTKLPPTLESIIELAGIIVEKAKNQKT